MTVTHEPSLDQIDLLDSARFAEGVPWEWFELLRREAPVLWHDEPDGPGFWAVTRYDDVSTINRDHRVFSSAVGGVMIEDPEPELLVLLAEQMLNMDPPRHTKLRLLVNKGFTPRMVGQLQDAIRGQCTRIVNAVIERGECDFVNDVAAELPLQVIAEMLGVPEGDRHQIFEWTNTLVGNQDPEYAVTLEDAMDAGMQMFYYSAELAQQKREHPDEGIVSRLLEAEVEGQRLTDGEFNLFFQLLAVAGNETTRNAISHGMQTFFDHPDQWQRLRDDPGLLDLAVDEIVRWATPVIYFRRTATEDTELSGTKIAEGDKVAMYLISANRDRDAFDEPGRFDIGRDPNHHLGFGAGGPHFCLGANLARAEIKAMFSEILRRLPDIEPTGPPVRLQSYFINGIKHLPVAF